MVPHTPFPADRPGRPPVVLVQGLRVLEGHGHIRPIAPELDLSAVLADRVAKEQA